MQDPEFVTRLQFYQQQARNGSNVGRVVEEVMGLPHSDAWKILERILQISQAKPSQLAQLRHVMQKSVRSVRSLTMLMFVYSLKLRWREFTFYGVNWGEQFREVALGQGQISVLSSWVSSMYAEPIVQDSLGMVVSAFAQMLKRQRVQFGEELLGSVMEWVAYLETADPKKYADVCELIKLAKQARFPSEKSEILVLRKLIETACQVRSPSSNLFLFMHPMPFIDNDIIYFCNIYSEYLTDIGEDGLLSIFSSLARAAMSKEILLTISNISCLLAAEEEYYKLRFLYQHFILPVLVTRAKACSKVEDLVYQTCSLYIIGFLRHCDIGMEGMACVIKNIGAIRSYVVKQNWLQLCAVLVSKYPEHRDQTHRILRQELNSDFTLRQLSEEQIEESLAGRAWDITLRNGRKHKKYVKQPSKMNGIQNRNNQCYIISVVHALQKNRIFEGLLDRNRDSIKGKLKLLDELRILFNEVSGRKNVEKIVISYLKKLSPEEFVHARTQEDAYEYMIRLMETIEKQLEQVPAILTAFQDLFQFAEKYTTICSKCGETHERTNKFYVHSISHTAVLSEQSEEPISDYVCPKCKSDNSTVQKRRLIASSKVLYVHISRSSHHQGQVAKQLSTQTILRDFLGYELMGIICHRGRKVSSGHYIYFHRVSPKRWAQFNDSIVHEFDLDQPYEQFERDWKAEMTPYILVYVLKNLS